METDTGKVASDGAERTPKVRGERMRIVQDYGGGIQLLRQPDAFLQPEPCAFRARRDPCQREVGDKMVVGVKSAHVAMASGEHHFGDAFLLAGHRHETEEPPGLVARYGMPRMLHVRRTCLRDIQSDGRIHRVPEAEIGDRQSKLVQPGGKVPRQQRAAREAEEEDVRTCAVLRQRFVACLEPPSRQAEYVPPVGADYRAAEIRAKARAGARFEMKLLPCVLNAEDESHRAKDRIFLNLSPTFSLPPIGRYGRIVRVRNG